MPSTMIHLLTARELLAAHNINSEAPGLFWFGNFAPDFTEEREKKDLIHFRTVPDWLEALRQLKDSLDLANPFQLGWLLHLFADLCWDETVFQAFRLKYENAPVQPWFRTYRNEIGLATYYLYHHIDWAPAVFGQIKNTDMQDIPAILPVTGEELEQFRDRVHKKHTESDPASVSSEYSEEMMMRFARATARKFTEWAAVTAPIVWRNRYA